MARNYFLCNTIFELQVITVNYFMHLVQSEYCCGYYSYYRVRIELLGSYRVRRILNTKQFKNCSVSWWIFILEYEFTRNACVWRYLQGSLTTVSHFFRYHLGDPNNNLDVIGIDIFFLNFGCYAWFLINIFKNFFILKYFLKHIL